MNDTTTSLRAELESALCLLAPSDPVTKLIRRLDAAVTQAREALAVLLRRTCPDPDEIVCDVPEHEQARRALLALCALGGEEER